MQTAINFKVDFNYAGQRIDKALSKLLPSQGTRGSKRLIVNGCVLLNEKITQPHMRLKEGDLITIVEDIPNIPQEIKIIKKDAAYLFLYKPAYLHCAELGGDNQQSLQKYLPHILSSQGIRQKAHLLQRLDYCTSGIVLASTDDSCSQEYLKAQKEGKCKKLYLAILDGVLQTEKTVKNALDTKKNKRTKVLTKDDELIRHSAFTPIHIWPKASDLPDAFSSFYKDNNLIKNIDKGLTLAGCAIRKGARHQIRAHAASIGLPLLGDGLYNEKSPEKDMFLLHQTCLTFPGHNCFNLPLWLPLECQENTLARIEENA